MPAGRFLGMGRRSRSTPSLSNNKNTTSSTTTAAPDPSTTDSADSAGSPPSPTQPVSPAQSSNKSSRPSLLSRLSLPLSIRSRNRNIADFHIRPEEPYRRYIAGEHVRGAIIIVVVKPIRITHLVVSLHGYVRALKDPASVAKTQGTTQMPQGGGSMRPRYHGHGLASLFQDEQVLSGEGRLEPGKYEFGFDLVFPEKGLPSSIDFERGTISYNIVATLTRPTSIAPTSTCDRKVMLVENVDIALVQPPRPRTIFLEPISRRTRRKKSMTLEKTAASPTEASELSPDSDPSDPSSPGASDEARDHGVDGRSPIPSDLRSEISGESTSTGVSRNDLSLSQIGTLTSPSRQQAVDKKTITTTIELIRGGCLPGDLVAVRIGVQHVKVVKSMTGIIVTLYRQGKIDSAPSEALFNENLTEGERRLAEKEDVYPRSRTGLGGLSLSSSSSMSMFRKDLDQSTAPLMIDPATLQSTATVTVKLPDDAFPTIRGVPGEMINFKYQVEVVVDLGGRLASQLQGGPSNRSISYANADSNTPSYNPMNYSNIADTTQLRREKGVVSVSIETIVGTMDSSRGQKRSSPTSRRVQLQEGEDEYIRPDLGYEEIPYEYPHNGQLSPIDYFPPQTNGHPPPPLPPHPPYSPRTPPQHSQQMQRPNGFSPPAAPAYVPPPQIPEHGELSEKEQIRHAETRLLPSAPPVAGPSNSANDEDIYDADDTPRVPHIEVGYSPNGAADVPSAPTEDEITTATAPPAEALEDKQEREHRRLMNEASAPPEFPDDVDQANSGPSRDAAPDLEPSAPALDDADDFPGLGSVAGPSASSGRGEGEQLPAYQR